MSASQQVNQLREQTEERKSEGVIRMLVGCSSLSENSKVSQVKFTFVDVFPTATRNERRRNEKSVTASAAAFFRRCAINHLISMRCQNWQQQHSRDGENDHSKTTLSKH